MCLKNRKSLHSEKLYIPLRFYLYVESKNVTESKSRKRAAVAVGWD